MNLLVFDLETTGTNVEQDEIIQIGAMVIELPSNKILGTFEVKMLPSKKGCEGLAKMATEGFVNCYDSAEWERLAVSPGLGLNRFAGWAKKFADKQLISKKGKPYFVVQGCGYNAAKFDHPFLLNQCRKYNVFMPMSMQCWDTLQLAMFAFYLVGQEVENYKLETVTKEMGVTLENAHDALADVTATAQLTIKLLQMWP